MTTGKRGAYLMPSQLPKFTLRIPVDLLDKLKVIAKKNCRSVNKEIEMVLREYISKNDEGNDR